MGTFHDTTDPLHGITVVAEAGDIVYVGRCHARENGTIVLLDVDQHSEGEDGKTNQEYLERAAKFGVWKKHEKLVLSADEVNSLVPLSEHFKRPGEPGAKPAVAEAEVTLEAAVAAPAPQALATLEPLTATAEAPIQLTDAAASEVVRLLSEENIDGQGLRLAVSGGGCSGLVYNVEFDQEKAGDIVVAFEGFKVFLDRKSTIYLRGVTLDHQKGLSGKGFQFHNPNASNTCGCGESFSV